MGSLTGVEVLHFMSMTCQVELSAVNAVNQYCWQLLLRPLLNNSQLTPPICLTFTGFDTHTPDWGAQTIYTHTHMRICRLHRGVAHKHTQMCTVCECGTTVLRMMGCLLQGVMNLYPPSASLKDSRSGSAITEWTHTTHTHTPTPPLPPLLTYPCSESGIYAEILCPCLL